MTVLRILYLKDSNNQCFQEAGLLIILNGKLLLSFKVLVENILYAFSKRKFNWNLNIMWSYEDITLPDIKSSTYLTSSGCITQGKPCIRQESKQQNEFHLDSHDFEMKARRTKAHMN